MTRKIYMDVPGGILYRDLRALLFWASIGVAKSKSGQYPEIEERAGDPGVLVSYSEHIGYKLPYPARFDSMREQAQERKLMECKPARRKVKRGR